MLPQSEAAHVHEAFYVPLLLPGFHFVDAFLCCTKALGLTRFHSFIFAFISFTFGEDQKYIAALCQRVFCLCNFKVLLSTYCLLCLCYSYFDDRDPPSLNMENMF